MEFAFKICKVPLTKTSDSLDWINYAETREGKHNENN